MGEVDTILKNLDKKAKGNRAGGGRRGEAKNRPPSAALWDVAPSCPRLRRMPCSVCGRDGFLRRHHPGAETAWVVDWRPSAARDTPLGYARQACVGVTLSAQLT